MPCLRPGAPKRHLTGPPTPSSPICDPAAPQTHPIKTATFLTKICSCYRRCRHHEMPCSFQLQTCFCTTNFFFSHLIDDYFALLCDILGVGISLLLLIFFVCLSVIILDAIMTTKTTKGVRNGLLAQCIGGFCDICLKRVFYFRVSPLFFFFSRKLVAFEMDPLSSSFQHDSTLFSC